MRFLLLNLLLCMTLVPALAQVIVSIGGFGGLTRAESSFETSGLSEQFELQPSWQSQAGFDLSFGLSQQATIHTGFRLTNKGFNGILNGAGPSQAILHKWTTLEFPFAFSYRQRLAANLYLNQQYGVTLDVIQSELPIEPPTSPSYFIIAPNHEQSLSSTIFAGIRFEYILRSGFTLYSGVTYHQGLTGHFRIAELIHKTPDLSQRADVLTDGSYLAFQLGVQLPPAQIAGFFDILFD